MVCTAAMAWSCRPIVPSTLPVCRAEVASAHADDVAGRELPAAIWFSILLRDFDRETSVAEAPVHDCSGRPLRPEVEQDCLDALTEGTPRQLSAADLHVESAADDHVLVWIRAVDHRDATASGPVAWAQWTDRGVMVRALGSLRTPPKGVSLRVAATGSGSVLVAEGERCGLGEDSDVCVRSVKFLGLEGDRFVERPLRAGDGRCLGPPAFDLAQSASRQLADGRHRTFALRRTFEVIPEGVVMQEQVVVEDSDPQQPSAPATLFRRATVQRRVSQHPDAWISDKPEIWHAMLAEHGAVTVEAHDHDVSTPPNQSMP